MIVAFRLVTGATEIRTGVAHIGRPHGRAYALTTHHEGHGTRHLRIEGVREVVILRGAEKKPPGLRLV